VVAALVVAVALLLGSSVPVGAQDPTEPPTEVDLPAVVDPEGRLTDAESELVAALVDRAERARAVDIVTIWVSDLGDSDPVDTAVLLGPPVTSEPRITLVASLDPPGRVEVLSSPQDFSATDVAGGADAATAAQRLLDDDPTATYDAVVAYLDVLIKGGGNPTGGDGDEPASVSFVVNAFLLLWLVLLGVFLLLRIPVPMKSIRLNDVGEVQAAVLVDDLLWGINDGRFGFPSGFFMADAARTEAPRRLVYDEYVPEGTVLTRVSRWLTANSTLLPGAGALVALVLLACFWLVLGLWMWLAEQLSKRLLRSRIRVAITPSEDRRGSVVDISTRGPCAHLLRGRIRAAFADPELPGRFRSLVPSASTAEVAP